MLTNQDLRQISEKGISEEKLNNQLEQFKTGFPFLKLEAAAAIGKGICAPKADEQQQFINAWNDYKAEGHKVVKFVPASGAASRMFKDMFAFVDAAYDVPTTDFENITLTTSTSLPSSKHSTPSARRTRARVLTSSWPLATTRL